jgi:DNA transposition AAA+ family ATPase
MNDPTKTPIDVEEQRSWLMSHKGLTGASWTVLATQSGIPAGTLSQFGPGSYKGDNEKVARDVFRFRQHLAMQAELDVEAPEIPGFIETPTSRRLISLLRWAHRGRIVVAAMGPGTSKTVTCRHYRDSASNVWLATMTPSTANMNNMMIELLSVMGERDAHGSSQMLSRRIRERVQGSGGLIILDEAQHLSEKAIEEIRSWHDVTGVGIALFGNESVVGRLEGGSRKAAYAQLFSRVAMRHIQNLPLPEDARVLAGAWGVEDPKLVAFIVSKSQMPGGLRGVTMMLELATMIAVSERRPLELSHLGDAWAQLVSRPLAA